MSEGTEHSPRLIEAPLPLPETPGPKKGMKEKYEADLAAAATQNAELRLRVDELERQLGRCQTYVGELEAQLEQFRQLKPR